MSVCDKCIAPGACCRDIPLFLSPDMTTLEVMVLLATYDGGGINKEPGLPFHSPVRKNIIFHQATNQERTIWVMQCLYIQPDGRCGNYENRPHWPCGAYEPGQDPLCAHFVRDIPLCGELNTPSTDHVKYKEERKP